MTELEEIDIEQLKRQDQDAWRHAVDVYYPGLVLFCGRFVTDPSDAYEIAHETYIKAKRCIDSFNSSKYSSFRPWLLQIAKNTAFDRINSRKKEANRLLLPRPSESATTQLYIKLAESGPGPRTNMHRKDVHAILYKALDKIDPIFREIIMLRYIDNLTRKEISEYLDIPENTAKSRLRLALEKLRGLIPGNTF